MDRSVLSFKSKYDPERVMDTKNQAPNKQLLTFNKKFEKEKNILVFRALILARTAWRVWTTFINKQDQRLISYSVYVRHHNPNITF